MRPKLHNSASLPDIKNKHNLHDIEKHREILIDDLLLGYDSIDLEGINEVKFMKRIDKKYTFHAKYLEDLLFQIRDDFRVLTISDQRQMLYMTQYFDTPDKQLYLCHHNGKQNRYKIRKRKYAVSGLTFLEIKFKDNKKITHKSRIESSPNLSVISTGEQEFLHENTGYTVLELIPGLFNQFNRITLIDKGFTQRITIDTGIIFVYNDRYQRVENLVVMETKSSSDKANRKIQYILKDREIYPDGFSKYCMGTAILSNSVKKNAFKERIRKIDAISALY